MQWLLLNQHYVSLHPIDLEISVLEEVVSSEQQLVSVLVSGHISLETMNSVDQEGYNQIEHTGVSL